MTSHDTLPRSHFLMLTGMELARMRSLQRRHQLPFNLDQEENGRGYAWCEAFMVLAMDDFGAADGHAVAMVRAADIAAALPPAIEPHWARIVRDGQLIASGTAKRLVPILAGRTEAPDQRPMAVCGTLSEIHKAAAALAVPPTRLILSDAGRLVSLLLLRAAGAGIRIPADLATAPLSYRRRLAA